MPVFVLNFQEFEDKCFCVCEPSNLAFLGTWQIHMFAGAKRLRDDSLRRRAGLRCARYDRYEASEEASWSSHSDDFVLYNRINENKVIPKSFVFEGRSTIGNFSMKLVVNYLDLDKLYATGARLEAEEYILENPDFTGSSLTYEEIQIDRNVYFNENIDPQLFDQFRSVSRRTWEVLENKSLLETRTNEFTVVDAIVADDRMSVNFRKRPPNISTSTNGGASAELRLLLDRYDPTIDFGDVIEESLSINPMVGLFQRVRGIDESSSTVSREVPGVIAGYTLTTHTKYDSTWNSKVERLTPPLFQIVASVEDINTLKFFPHGEGRVEIDQFTQEVTPIEPGNTNNGIPLTFNYGAVDDFETVGWLFNEDADWSPTNTNFIKFYSPILQRSEVTEYTCLTTKDRETNYVNDGVSHGGFHYPGRKFNPADVDG